MNKIFQCLQKNKTTLLPYIIILLVGLLAIVWFEKRFLISAMDFDFPLDRARAFLRTTYIWDQHGGLGESNLRILPGAIPYGLFLALTNLLNISLVMTEKVLFYTWFAGAGLSMCYLTQTLIKERKYIAIASTLSGLFYMMNPFSLIFIWSRVNTGVFFYAFIPLILALFIKFLIEKEKLRNMIILCFVWLLTLNGAYSNPRWIIFSWSILFLYFVFHIITIKRKSRLKLFGSLTLLITLWALMNSYWLIGSLLQSNDIMASARIGYDAIKHSNIDGYILNSASTLDTLRMAGYWALDKGYYGDPYYRWTSVYSNWFFVVISFLTPILAFLGIFLKTNMKNTLFFTFLLLISIFFIKGFNPPFETINEYIVKNDIILTLIRNPFADVGFLWAISSSFLIGQSIGYLYYKIRK